MANGKLASETILKDPNEVRYVNFDFSADLAGTGRSLTGTPTITEVGTSDLTIDNITASSPYAQCKISGGSSGTEYLLKCTTVDNGTPAQTLIGFGRLLVQTES